MSEHTPTPWMKGEYKTTDAFRAIEEHECLCREDGSLIALFGPKGDPQSIIDRDAAGRAVNSHEALLEAAKNALHHLGMVGDYEVKTEKVYLDLEIAIAQAQAEARP